MTQGQLAERLHVKQASVSMIESGELEPTDDLRTRLKAWIDSGAGPKNPAPRGPREHYETKKRRTIP